MENLRRKEHAASPTVSQEDNLVRTTKLRSPHLREDALALQHLLYRLKNALHSHLLILIFSPAGYGMVMLAHASTDLPREYAVSRGAPPEWLE